MLKTQEHRRHLSKLISALRALQPVDTGSFKAGSTPEKVRRYESHLDSHLHKLRQLGYAFDLDALDRAYTLDSLKRQALREYQRKCQDELSLDETLADEINSALDGDDLSNALGHLTTFINETWSVSMRQPVLLSRSGKAQASASAALEQPIEKKASAEKTRDVSTSMIPGMHEQGFWVDITPLGAHEEAQEACAQEDDAADFMQKMMDLSDSFINEDESTTFDLERLISSQKDSSKKYQRLKDYALQMLRIVEDKGEVNCGPHKTERSKELFLQVQSLDEKAIYPDKFFYKFSKKPRAMKIRCSRSVQEGYQDDEMVFLAKAIYSSSMLWLEKHQPKVRALRIELKSYAPLGQDLQAQQGRVLAILKQLAEQGDCAHLLRFVEPPHLVQQESALWSH